MTADVPLLLRRANVSRKGGTWDDDDYDVFDGAERLVGRVFLMAGGEAWFWGLAFEFQLSGRKRYGRSPSLDGAKAAFRAEYETTR